MMDYYDYDSLDTFNFEKAEQLELNILEMISNPNKQYYHHSSPAWSIAALLVYLEDRVDKLERDQEN
jgi:hypothetical protein